MDSADELTAVHSLVSSQLHKTVNRNTQRIHIDAQLLVHWLLDEHVCPHLPTSTDSNFFKGIRCSVLDVVGSLLSKWGFVRLNIGSRRDRENLSIHTNYRFLRALRSKLRMGTMRRGTSVDPLVPGINFAASVEEHSTIPFLQYLDTTAWKTSLGCRRSFPFWQRILVFSYTLRHSTMRAYADLAMPTVLEPKS